ncbi:MAG: sulfite exporter TauE/SafE family protein [Thermoleophilia bacterium]
MEVLLVIALGVAAGAVAGLFGVGGGIIFVPALTLVLGLTQLEAEATSLLAIIPVAVLGSWRQTRAGTVRWRDATVMGVVSVATAVLGAFLADAAPERALRIGFALLLVATAVQLILRARHQSE